MTFEELLRSQGLTPTRGRKEIFNLLNAAGRPLSVNEIISQSPALDRATIYRIIKLFNQLEITKQVWVAGKLRIELGDKFVEHHHYIACQKCGRLEIIDSDQLEKIIKRAVNKSDYKLMSHQIELIGLCSNCR